MNLEDNLKTNDFGEIHIAPIEGNYESLDRYVYSDAAHDVMSVIDLTNVYSMLQDTNVKLSLDYLLNWHDEEEVESQTFKEHADNFRKNTYWLTGSENKGGIFFFRIGNDLNAGVFYRLLDKEESDKTYIRYYTGYTQTLGLNTPYELSEVAIGFRDSASEDYPSFQFFAKQTSEGVDYKVIYYRPADDAEAQISDTLFEAIEDCSYSDDIPNQAWDWSFINTAVIVTIPPQDVDPSSGSGSWNGGSVIDPEYNPYPDDAGGTHEEDNTDKPATDKIDVDDPNESGIDACNSGFVTLYQPTKQSVIDFNNYLFTDITDSISQQLKRLISDPFEYIVFIAMCHFTPTTSIAQHNILFAGIDSGISAPIISPQFKTIDCGTIQIPQNNKNFTDYSPLSKAFIYLPYVGFRELKIDEIRGAELSLTYRVDMMTGSFVATLLAKRGVRGYWNTSQSKDYELQAIILIAEGNCYEMLPISATDYRNFYNGLMGVIGGGMAVTSGNISAGLGAMGTSVASMKPSVNRSGNPTGNYGYFGNQTAYVVVEFPFGANPPEMGLYEGYPSNLYLNIGSLADAYVEIDPDTIWMDEIPCFDDEMNEIKDLLNKGVYVNNVDTEYN